ncbi:glycosyltransferase family 2 protein [Brevibacillus choshinensis]|uniref:Glycosyltransferase n=1 Tax=Brevibacillus choshinensis TaxID=54911 RepID=A0ABX7FHL2_BRECH|nr:glycosyltransferase [Brevibacillus choshinensis]QRG65713.1 glycosyltransferase [Brevibacillus choshinensis]
MNRRRILIGSPVHQEPEILRLFLESLLALNKESVELHFLFIDDNEKSNSSEMLRSFRENNLHVEIIEANSGDLYIRDEATHYWSESLIWKVAEFKNEIIRRALNGSYDYLFLIDSDVLVHPQTIEHLVKKQKDIVAEIFWTRWQPEATPQPQVWLKDVYTQYEQERGENVTEAEKEARYTAFLSQLKKPGIYEVGGLGACTLISRKVLLAGVHFSQIKNLSFWGEDRHFCIRAAAFGFSLFVDTEYPAFHIYRKSDLAKAEQFMQDFRKNQHNRPIQAREVLGFPWGAYIPKRPQITLSMVVKNEANRYLKKALIQHRAYIDNAVIIDDGSRDDTVEVCRELLKGIPLRIIRNEVSKFTNEIELRRQQWEETIKTNPEWILNLDADELFEERFKTEVNDLISRKDIDLYNFRLFDFWNETHYREDSYWCAHFTYRPFLLRYRPHFEYRWKVAPQHCGRFPENIFQLPNTISPIRLKHYGWAKWEDRLEKYERFLSLDPEAKFGWREQYLSILDDCPNLVPWVEEEREGSPA